MRNINFSQITLAIAAAGILFSYSGLPAHGYGSCQYAAMSENGAKCDDGSCYNNSPDSGKCNGKSAAGKEECNASMDKEKIEKGNKGKVEDFCKLKDLR